MAKYNIDAEIKSLLDHMKDCDNHDFVADAERAVFAAQGFLNRLVELNRNGEMDDVLNSTLDALSDLVGRAAAREEDDRVNRDWYRACAAAELNREV